MGTQPFMVSWDVRIYGGSERLAEAQTLAAKINELKGPMPTLIPDSIARVPHATFPPVSPPTTTAIPSLSPYGFLKPSDSSLSVAKHALAVAKKNEASLDRLLLRLHKAGEAAADGLTYTKPTPPPAHAEGRRQLGDLVAQALVTPAPPPLPPLPAAPAPSPGPSPGPAPAPALIPR